MDGLSWLPETQLPHRISNQDKLKHFDNQPHHTFGFYLNKSLTMAFATLYNFFKSPHEQQMHLFNGHIQNV